jgi:hypothetical protein
LLTRGLGQRGQQGHGCVHSVIGSCHAADALTPDRTASVGATGGRCRTSESGARTAVAVTAGAASDGTIPMIASSTMASASGSQPPGLVPGSQNAWASIRQAHERPAESAIPQGERALG